MQPMTSTEIAEAARLAELQAQVASLRRTHKQRHSDRDPHTLYVILGVVMAMFTSLLVVAMYIFRPGDPGAVTVIIGVVMPSALGLIGYGLQHNIRGVYSLADGNLSVVRHDLGVALSRINNLQEKRIEEAKNTIPMVVEGDQLKVSPNASGMVIEKNGAQQ